MSEGARKARFAAALARLRDQIRRGPNLENAMLPGERDLAEQLSISRTTVRRMLAMLVDEGLLTHRQGVGTFVRLPPGDPATRAGASAQDAPSPLAGFTAAVHRLGRQPSSRDLLRASGWATPEEAMIMACPPDAPVIRLSRLRCIDDEPVARERAVLPSWALTGSEAMDSLYVAMAAAGIRPERALQRMRVGIAEPADAASLGIPAASAVVRLRRTDYLADGRCCAFTRTVLRAEHFDLLVEARTSSPPLGLASFAEPVTSSFA